MSKHTEGPWKVVDGHYPGFLKIVGTSFEPSIVLVATDLDFKDFCTRTADAHLMASSPDMYSALEFIARESNDPVIKDLAAKTIAIANGDAQ